VAFAPIERHLLSRHYEKDEAGRVEIESQRIARRAQSPSHLRCERKGRISPVTLEILHRPLVRFGCFARSEGSKVAALASFGILFS